MSLDTIPSGLRTPEVIVNANFQAMDPAKMFGIHLSATAGLTLGIYGGNMLVSGTNTLIADTTLALTASSTCYVEATTAGVVSFNTSAFTGGRIQIGIAVTGASTITTWTDKRVSGAVGGGGGAPTESIIAAASDETTPLTATAGVMTFRMPYAFTLTAVRASLTTAQASGSIFTVDINMGGTSILSTVLTIDNTEKTSTTAATPAAIGTSALTSDAEITIDVDQIGDGTAKGLKVVLIGHQ